MANYLWVADGGVEIGGCASVSLDRVLSLAFNVGDIVFLRSKALVGVLERVAIKRIVSRNDTTFSSGKGYLVNYVDSYNSRYMELELVSYEDALALVNAYKERQSIIQSNTDLCE